MKNKLIFLIAALILAAALPFTANAELGIKPVADPWEAP